MPRITLYRALICLAFILSGCGGGGGGGSSGEPSVSLTNGLVAPSLRQEAVSDDSAGLSWTPVNNALFYKVFRNGVEITPISGWLMSEFEDSGLSPNTSYSYTTQSCDSTQCSAQSSELKVSTSAPITAPPPKHRQA